jgi:hypothetical protein
MAQVCLYSEFAQVAVGLAKLIIEKNMIENGMNGIDFDN